MPSGNHLKLRTVTLREAEQWADREEGVGFLLAREGQGTYVASRFEKLLQPGQVLAANAAKEWHLTGASPAGFTFFWFRLCLEHCFPLFAVEEVARLGAVIESLDQPQILSSSSAVAKQCHEALRVIPVEHTLEHRTQLLNIAIKILAGQFEAVRQQRLAFPTEHLTEVLGQCSADELLAMSVEDLAGRFHCSRRHLSRLFQHRFGFSIAALRMELRMMKAVTLLRNPDAKVLLIAEQCGFNHLGLFNICFKKRFHMTPTEWRKQHNGIPAAQLQRSGLRPLCPLHFTRPCHLTQELQAQPVTAD